ncbi:inositol monophosphatase family protein [Tomitella fengzijianii]|uniref:inositol monophosphatase family protein n=1 Tax=Tomitella fengzijianii TaxID=2597660 RepID=UPI003556E70E
MDRPENRYGPGSGEAPAIDGAGAQELLTVAVDVAQAAAAHVRGRRPEVFGGPGGGPRGGGAVRAKSTPTDPVTVVDTESEDLVRSMLARLRPGDTVLGEEAGGGAARPGAVRWVVDPIDGTVNFLYGIPAYAVSLAAQIDGRSVAGAVVDVAGRRLYSATAGGGAHVTEADGTVSPLQVTGVTDPAVALVATGFGYERSRRVRQGRVIAELLPQVRDIRRIGAGALDLCMVADGQVDAHFEHGLSPWDWAAGALIAGEAGAVVHVPGPDSTSGEGAVTLAAAPGIATALRRILDRAGGLDPIPAQ